MWVISDDGSKHEVAPCAKCGHSEQPVEEKFESLSNEYDAEKLTNGMTCMVDGKRVTFGEFQSINEYWLKEPGASKYTKELLERVLSPLGYEDDDQTCRIGDVYVAAQKFGADLVNATRPGAGQDAVIRKLRECVADAYEAILFEGVDGL